MNVFERWKPIPGFDSYQISDQGRIYNTRANITMSLNTTLQGDLKVSLWESGERTTRSVRVLVAEMFVPNPNPNDSEYGEAFDTVIVLDGNKNNVSFRNLAWRPTWFAYMYAVQFNKPYSDTYYKHPVENKNTGAVYRSIFECATREGLILEHVFDSVSRSNGCPVFPHNHVYSWVNV